MKNLKGFKFNQLTVIEFFKKDSRSKNYWKCECSCGNITVVEEYNLKNKTKSCGCLVFAKRPEQSEKLKKSKGSASLNSLYYVYTKGAKRRNIEFSLSKDDFKCITKLNCHYCGKIPSQIYTNPTNGITNGSYIYNGVDRKDNKKGYTVDNCVACCKICNTMKMQLSISEFLEHVCNIARYNNM